MNAIQTNCISLNVHHFKLDNISLTIPNQKISSIVGPNGSGKSTLLKIISNLLKADQGSVYIYEKEAQCYKNKEFAQKITMLQQSKNQLPNLTVKELISFGRSPYKHFFSNQLSMEDEQIISEAMQITNITNYKNRLFYSLSGGEQQKVRIAMALAQKTSILLLDEPTTYLDISHQFEVMELLQYINKHFNITIIMVLHDLQQAATYSNYMIALKQGKIVQRGIPNEVLTKEFLQSVYNLQARIKFEDGYPLIIPNIRR
ncbi:MULTISPECIES: ABC transporter ATP-binding protein [Virgibacillus]|uniref:ABC transporter ATP-binding protein n=1 Tax=Virgibacillus dokdonensis TaxID=302167 RepID=A0A2K9IX02_9BACI|nr:MULTISPECIES: ABC transporter ATP-binding protein [Virgibacillus]AUJ24298.1 putative siderophore transport system ATP-binding protein YusV [Virgibacillus dokdonensis]NWO12631.1 ABC transporter ATP-binding protein [Virgibacillus sp.]